MSDPLLPPNEPEDIGISDDDNDSDSIISQISLISCGSLDEDKEEEGGEWSFNFPRDAEAKTNNGSGPSVQKLVSAVNPRVPEEERIDLDPNIPGPSMTSTPRVSERTPIMDSTVPAKKRKMSFSFNPDSSDSDSDSDDCKMLTSEPCIQSKSSGFTTTIRQRKELHKDLLGLWRSKDFSDIEIHCEEDSVKAHKLIVSARSDVFRAMFESGMSEASSNSIKIDDIKLDTMKTLLEYMYTGRVNPLPLEDMTDLIRAADKYQMNTLKIQCFKLLIAKIKLGNAAELVMLAHLHNASVENKKCIQEYILWRREDLWVLPEFKATVAANPLVFATIMFESYGGGKDRVMC